jgi:casein kinase II subunit beta
MVSQLYLVIRRTDVPGAFFGTTFAPLFFQTYPEFLAAPFYASPSTSSSTPADRGYSPSPSPSRVGGETFTNPNPHGGQKAALGRVYVPRIYGFKVSERARSGPRMRWLRERPERAEDMDLVDRFGRWKGQASREAGEDEEMVLERSKGALFDDEDEVEEEDEEEEEEEAPAAEVRQVIHPPASAKAPAGTSRGQGRR